MGMSSVVAVDPRTGSELEAYPAATVADVDPALQAAVAAQPALRADAPRAALLRGIADGLRARADDVVAVAGAETGLPEPRLRGELARTAFQLERLAAHVEAGEHHQAVIDPPDPSWTPVARPDLRRVRVPLGPVAVFGASNFPLAFSTAGGDTGAALAAGCPVVVKGHPSHPGTGVLVAAVIDEAVRAAGLPAGVFAHLLAAELDVAEALVDHPALAAVAFTGSFRGGTALLRRAQARPRPIPVFAEMGSLNPVVVTAAAIAARGEAIAQALAGAVGTFGGQLCTKPGVVLAGGPLADALERELEALGPQVLLNAQIAHAYGTDGGCLATPEVERVGVDALGDVEERFGPAVVVAEWRDEAELHAALGALGGQLAAGLYAEPHEHEALAPVVDRLAALAGRVLFDGVPTGVAVTRAMHHGGPWPATSDAASTSVGVAAVDRFTRPVVFQDAPAALLPPALRDDNPLGIERVLDGVRTR
jgi:2,5-dioxopentanoate dehydrogenase